MLTDSTLAQLVLAYRKAKVDLYRSSDPRIQEILEYEDNLAENLSNLANLIDSGETSWVANPEFVGTFTFTPESVRDVPAPSKNDIISSDPVRAWLTASNSEKPKARFRLMSKCSIDMHVLSTHWILTVGHKLESRLGASSMGNRIARDYTGKVRTFSNGSFQHYLGPYRRWRDDGLSAIQNHLQLGKSLIALTADVTSFYHRLHPEFLSNDDFINSVLGVTLTEKELRIHSLFVGALSTWTRHVSSSTGWEEVGLPVGLPASAVVANLALIELDWISEEEFKPVYYARYVDDIMLVIEEDRNLETHRDLWAWLIHRSRGLLRFANPANSKKNGDNSIRFTPPYLSKSTVEFENSKNKIFHLTGPSGEAMIASIRREIDARSSEWRSFTEVPRDPHSVGGEIARATQIDGETASTLRDADQVSVRRSAFAIKLREFESYERNLDLESWTGVRRAFFDLVINQILVLPTFFDFADYLPRLIKLAAACGDAESLRALFTALAAINQAVASTCNVTVKCYAEENSSDFPVLPVWNENVGRQCLDNLASGLTKELPPEEVEAIISLVPGRNKKKTMRNGALLALNARLRKRDLAHIPFRFSLLEADYVPRRSATESMPITPDRSLKKLPLHPELTDGADLLLSMVKKNREFKSATVQGHEVAGIVFATRPPNEWELFLATRKNKSDPSSFDSIKSVLASLRGYSSNRSTAQISTNSDGHPIWTVRSDHKPGTVLVALASVDTKDKEWRSAAIGAPELTAARFERFKRLFQEAISKRPRPNYILLPEFSIPSQWFISFADKLGLSGSSLIAGIEYRSGGRGKVRNQVWASLRTGGTDSGSYVVYVQDKQKPAHFERTLLHDLAGLELEPETPWVLPTIIEHGDFRFAILICSEMTNIAYRSSLRGRIDALLVPEWNQDLNTFGALVESAALDIHAYIIQANHRSFGDSRIRAPRTKEWERDIIRVRGGMHDHIVIGEIDYWSLREHQSAKHVRKGEFKPIPDGFEVEPARRRLPSGSAD